MLADRCLVGKSLLLFQSVERLGGQGGRGFDLTGEGESSREVWIEACFWFFSLFLVLGFDSGLA